MANNIDWILTANGPGEISGQVRPIAKEIKKQYPQGRIILIILPCQFASGYEQQIAENIEAIDVIISPGEYRKLIFNKKSIEELNLAEKGVILYLGGDQMHAILLKNRFGYPAYAYFEKERRASAKFSEVFTPKTVGNLMVDAAEGNVKYCGRDIKDSELSVGLFPGSRPGYVEYMVPLLIDISKKLQHKIRNIKFFWGIPEHLKSYVQEHLSEALEKYPDAAESKGLDLILTLLGTNTALHAVQGIPMLVLFPFHRPDLIPLMGLLGILAKIPILGWIIKWLALKLASYRLGYVALPNIISKSEVTPEIKGYFKPEDVVDKAYGLLKDVGWRNRISGQLRYSIGQGGAAKKIVEKIGANFL